jgi:beta-lactamase class A
VAIDAELAAVPGTVSAWYGPLGGPQRYARLADEPHYAASTMKVAVLVAVYRTVSDVDALVAVRNEFRSVAPGAPAFACRPEDDNDNEVWAKLGGTASLRWLARRMIVRSSNLATNLCLDAVGFDAVAEVWRLAGARHSAVGRYIEDSAAREAGITNVVTAADLAALLSGIALGRYERRDELLDVLLAQEGSASATSAAKRSTAAAPEQRTVDLVAGLPPGTRIAHKNGWVKGIRHGAGVVFPDDAPPYVVVCCTTTTVPDAEACRIVARVAAASWADRLVE